MRVSVQVERLPIRIGPDPRRVLSRFFTPADEQKARDRIDRVIALPEESVESILLETNQHYAAEHHDITADWLEHFHCVEHLLPEGCGPLSPARQQLIGAYFTMDYALEAVALFNPSIVEALDQSGLEPGSTRFGLSLRAVGEGHMSSIVFRTGVIDSHNNLTLNEPATTFRALTQETDPTFSTAMIRRTLRDLGAIGPLEESLLERLGETTSPAAIRSELARMRGEAALPAQWQRVRERLREKPSPAEIRSDLERFRKETASPAQWQRTRDNFLALIESNYSLQVPEGADLSELVIFPVSQNESRGIEDLRLVKFVDDDGSSTLLGTYTAFNGYTIFPTLLAISDPGHVETHTMSGDYARNKGMAIFPRKINGRYVMSGRLDGVNLYILESDSPLVWNEGRVSQQPKQWWQFSAIGNCGSPIETEEGWLMLTHGIGPMRQYCIGAVLLDLEDPTRVIGELEEPLISPTEDERVGYVPNVVYTCGSMIHNGSLIIPYAVSDVITKFARVDVEELLSALR